MLLGREVGLGQSDIVLDGVTGVPAPPPNKGHSHPLFGPCLLWLPTFLDPRPTRGMRQITLLRMLGKKVWSSCHNDVKQYG